MSAAATLVLIAIDRLTRRLLPLAALYKLSLVFPDAGALPVSGRAANGHRRSLAGARRLARGSRTRQTPVEAAEQLLALVAALDATTASPAATPNGCAPTHR